MNSFVSFLREHFAFRDADSNGPLAQRQAFQGPGQFGTGQSTTVVRRRTTPMTRPVNAAPSPLTEKTKPADGAEPATPVGGVTTAAATTPAPPVAGDINGDGKVGQDDLTLFDLGLSKYESGTIVQGSASLADGDVNGDGAVTTADYVLICTALPGAGNNPGDLPTAPILIPGNGFAGPTQQPAAAGTSDQAGYDAKAIARWDVVPYQTFDGLFNVGVVAFHMNDLDRVEFSVNGGVPLPVRTMTLNPATGVVEYVATLDADKFATDGAVEVRAVAYPKVGIPRVLDSLPLNANGNGTLQNPVRYVSATGSDTNDGLTPQTPKQTTNAAAASFQGGVADGGVIYLLPGEYTLSGAQWYSNSTTSTRWMTVTAAPGLDRSEVVVNGTAGAGFNSKLVRISNVTLTGFVQSGGPLVDYAWIDNCTMRGVSRVSGGAGAGASFTHRYLTNSSLSDASNGPEAYNLVRNVRVERIGGDAFSNTLMVINSTVHEADQAPGSHSDLWQWTSVTENVIMYGVDNTDRIGVLNSTMLFEGDAKNAALVNCRVSVGNGYYAVQLGHPLTHIVVKNTAFLGGTRLFTETLVAKDVIFEGCTFGTVAPIYPGITVR